MEGSVCPPDNHTRSHPRRPSKRAVRFAEAYYYAACMLRRVRAVTNIDVEPESISWVTGPGVGLEPAKIGCVWSPYAALLLATHPSKPPTTSQEKKPAAASPAPHSGTPKPPSQPLVAHKHLLKDSISWKFTISAGRHILLRHPSSTGFPE